MLPKVRRDSQDPRQASEFPSSNGTAGAPRRCPRASSGFLDRPRRTPSCPLEPRASEEAAILGGLLRLRELQEPHGHRGRDPRHKVEVPGLSGDELAAAILGGTDQSEHKRFCNVPLLFLYAALKQNEAPSPLT